MGLFEHGLGLQVPTSATTAAPRSPSRFAARPRHALTHYQQEKKDAVILRRHREQQQRLHQSRML
jgi:hypothetical protein